MHISEQAERVFEHVGVAPVIHDFGSMDAIAGCLCAGMGQAVLPASYLEGLLIGGDTEGRKGFITVLIRTRPGREDHVLLEVSEAARAAVLGHIKPVDGKILLVSVEVQMMNPVAVLHAKI